MTTLAGIMRADWGKSLKLSYRDGHLSWVIAATAAFYVAGMATRAVMRRLRAEPLFWLLRPKAPSLVLGIDPGTEDGSKVDAVMALAVATPYVFLSTPGPISFPDADFLAAGGMEAAEIQQVLGEPRQPQPYQVAAIESIESGGSSYNLKPTYPPSDRSGPRQRRPRGFKAS
jgi:hypothetical protein